MDDYAFFTSCHTRAASLTMIAMEFLLNPEFWVRWLSIVLIDLSLAGDNALVIALAVRSLPKRKQFWGRIWGSLGAVALRLIFIVLVTYLLKIPLLQLVGGLLLIWIAVKLVCEKNEGSEKIRGGTSLLQAVWIIIVADLIMSLDNVLAVAGAAHGNLWLVVFGIAFSLPIVVWGSGLLANLMNRFRWIIWLGGGVLGYVAGEMLFKDPFVKNGVQKLFANSEPLIAHLVSIVLGIGMIILGWQFEKRSRKFANHEREENAS